MRQNRTNSREHWGASSTDSGEDCSSLDDDPLTLSIYLVSDNRAATSAQKAYQGMVDMLDDDLRVICTSDDKQLVSCNNFKSKGRYTSSDKNIPCLATVLFFNGGHEKSSGFRRTSKLLSNGFSKPDLLQNHTWNSTLDLLDFEKDFRKTTDYNDNDVTLTKTKTGRNNKNGNSKCGRRSPFLRYDAILKESKEREKNSYVGKDVQFDKGHYFDMESAETTLEARKQLETWPWEFHHRAGTTKGISQCQNNSQDFYAYQPVQDVTRLYGDVIDTTKITRRKNINLLNECDRDFIELLDNTTDELRVKTTLNERNGACSTISATEFPLMAVREVHYGKQHLRHMLFVSDTTWRDQVEFYRLLLRRHEVNLREDFCFFTVYSGKKTDIQFALKRLSAKQNPIPLSSSIMQFKVHNVGHLVPLLPHSCKPISDSQWQTRDHDGNAILLQIQPIQLSESDTMSSSQGERDFPVVEDVITSPSEIDCKQSSDDEYSLERLDSFVEPELPHRMPLLRPALYPNLGGTHRFGRRTTSSASPGSSSSNSPERRPLHSYSYAPRLPRLFSDIPMEIGSCSTLPSPRHSSTPTRLTSSSRVSESSDEPENTNFYRRAKFKRDIRRKSEGSLPARAPRKTSRTRQKHNSQRKKETHEDEIELYV